MFSSIKLSANGRSKIDIFIETIKRIKEEKECSEYAKKTIDIVIAEIKAMQEEPKKILALTELFNQDSLQSLITDNHFRRLFENLINFIQSNRPDQLWDSATVKLSFATFRGQWEQALKNMQLTRELCSFISKADEFGQRFQFDEGKIQRDERKSPEVCYLDELQKPFDKTKGLLGEISNQTRQIKNLEYSLKQLKETDEKYIAKDKELKALLPKLQENKEILKKTYSEELRKFIDTEWKKVTELPYYFVRSIQPSRVTKNIEKSDDWNLECMRMWGCREQIIFIVLQLENEVQKFCGKIPLTDSFHHWMQQMIGSCQKESTEFNKRVLTQIQILKTAVEGYLKPGLLKGSKDPSKIALMEALKGDLEGCLRLKVLSSGELSKRAFKAIIRASLWHSKVLAQSIADKNPLSSGRVGKILNEHYEKLFGLFFSVNEFNSGYYQFSYPDIAVAEVKHDGASVSRLIPVAEYRPQNRDIPVELDKFNLAHTTLCPIEPVRTLAIKQ